MVGGEGGVGRGGVGVRDVGVVWAGSGVAGAAYLEVHRMVVGHTGRVRVGAPYG
jgi:hypothetical protein